MDKKYTYKIKGYCLWVSEMPTIVSLLAATPGVPLHTIKTNDYSNIFFKFTGTKQELIMLITILGKKSVKIEKMKKVWF